MKRPVFLLALIAIAVTPLAARESAGTVERKSHEHGAEEIRLTLPGHLVDYALPHHTGGGRDLVLLMKTLTLPDTDAPGNEAPRDPPSCIARVEPGKDDSGLEQPPLRLVRYSTDGRLEELDVSVPAGTESIETTGPTVSGDEDLLLIRPGELRVAGGSLLASDLEEAMTTDRYPSHLSPDPSPSLFPVTRLGVVSFYEASSPTRWTELAQVQIPVKARRDEGVLRLESPLLQEVGRPTHGRFLWAVGPEAAGRQRLRTVLIDPASPAGETSTTVWSRLPEPEIVMESGYALLDGRPILITLTRTALKLAIFEEKFLRIFYLDEKDRSRMGNLPAIAFETGANLWQGITPFFHDMDGDGTDDLVLGYWKGLKDDRVVLDTYLRKPDGSFRTSARTTEFDVEDANRSVLGFGRDLDGDGISELLLEASGAIQVYRGRDDQNEGKKLFDKEPQWTFGSTDSSSDSFEINLGFEGVGDDGPVILKSRFGNTRITDLDGDGRSEILITEREEAQTVVRILRL